MQPDPTASAHETPALPAGRPAAEILTELKALRTADARREIESLVIRLYFERRRLKAELATADAGDTSSDMRLELRIAEVEAELDALTGGAFTRLRRS